MNKAFALPLLLILAGFLFVHPRRSEQPRPLVFTHVTVIDATGASPEPDMTVMITGNHITAIVKTAASSIPKDAQVIDATGKFLIPGLWDMHVHWYGYDKAYLRLFTANGVTGVRVMWGA